MRNFLIIRQLYENIEGQCIRERESETGGELIGKIVGKDFLALLSASSNIGVSKGPAHYSINDTGDIQKKINCFLKLFPDFHIIGSWHKHPGGMDYPSAVDKRTAIEIVSDLGQLEKQIFPIILLNGFKIGVYPYLMANYRLDFKLLDMDILELGDDLIKKVISKSQLETVKDYYKLSDIKNEVIEDTSRALCSSKDINLAIKTGDRDE